jgi:hypothetical protein
VLPSFGLFCLAPLILPGDPLAGRRLDAALPDTLVVHWNKTPKRVAGTPEWEERTLTVKATGQDVRKFPTLAQKRPCLEAGGRRDCGQSGWRDKKETLE